MCPFNRRFAEPAGEPAYEAASDTDGQDLMELMGMTEEEFDPTDPEPIPEDHFDQSWGD